MDMSYDFNSEERKTDYLAEGTTFEGTLNVAGDLEVHGALNGEAAVSGNITLYNNAKCNVSAQTLDLHTATLRGDVVVSDAVRIDGSSIVFGNVRAAAVELLPAEAGPVPERDYGAPESPLPLKPRVSRVMEAAGTIAGAVRASEYAAFASGAQLIGDLSAPSLEIAPGARLSGKVDMTGTD